MSDLLVSARQLKIFGQVQLFIFIFTKNVNLYMITILIFGIIVESM